VPVLAELTAVDDAEGWRAAGFTVAGDGTCVLGDVVVRLEGGGHGLGITGWGFAGLERAEPIDGIPTTVVDGDRPEPVPHANGTTSIDHVVVRSPDSRRTTAALETVGLPAKRARDIGRGMQQVFFRAGAVIVELVGPVEPGGDGPAGFYGLAVNVTDLDLTKDTLGELVTDPKDAVQPGRRIATLRTRDLGIATAIAFMSQPERRS
jgi:hypothetical protein